MDSTIQWLMQVVASPAFRLVVKCLFIYYVVSGIIGHLPMPQPNAPWWWRGWVFPILNGIAANFNRAAVALKIPGAEAPK